MSFSLSSLLNPELAEPHSTEPPRKDSLPPSQHAQSPQAYQVSSSPQSAQAPPRDHYSYPPATAQEAAQALASLSASTAPPPTQYYGYSAPDYPQDERRTSLNHRSSISHGPPIELPPPSADGRKMSSHSPTLESYQVTSRSPEQRRSLMVHPAQSGFTLPPIQRFSSTQQEQTRRASVAQSPGQGVGEAETAESHVQLPMVASSDSYPATKSGDSASVHDEPAAPPMRQRSPPPAIATSIPLMAAQLDGVISSPADIKQEGMPTPRASSPSDARSSSQMEAENHTSKKVASLKNEHGLRTQSPLRESSVPVPSTEMAAPEQAAASKKRPAKKGTATTSKKAPPSKKRKIEVMRSETPSSRASKPSALKASSSNKGTPANSSPAPSNRSYSAEPNEEGYDEDEDVDDEDADGDVYCVCRKPDNGTFMIGCDGTCDDWYHGKCVGIEERDKNLIDKYMCPRCTNGGIGRTSWKRVCRRHGCRQPARVGKSRGGKDGSKYCSEECGVLYFREMVARTRNREDTMKSRSNRRKGSIVSTERPTVDDDLGAKGGLLAAGEVKSLIDSSKSAEDFKKLGEGVLSPPPTPNGKDASLKESEYTESEARALEQILTRKNDARRRHQLLKDRMKFVTMVKQAASRTTTEKELKPKEYCGYDPRLEWTEEQFAAWRDSPAGRQAFELETLATEKSGDKTGNGDTAMTDGDDEGVYAQIEICDRKKCARHLEWGKLSVDDIRFEMSDNSDNMRALDKEEREIKERAALRAKSGGVNGEGSVEVHGLGITNGETGEAMEVEERVEVVQQLAAPIGIEMGEAAMAVPALPETEAMAIDAAA
ncbi:hypothetical protein LTR85_000457 [Meristemomyces frigidus]|nr:hypothetical protein LTR85_000457 [Meristemomyces frigidus]